MVFQSSSNSMESNLSWIKQINKMSIDTLNRGHECSNYGTMFSSWKLRCFMTNITYTSASPQFLFVLFSNLSFPCRPLKILEEIIYSSRNTFPTPPLAQGRLPSSLELTPPPLSENSGSSPESLFVFRSPSRQKHLANLLCTSFGSIYPPPLIFLCQCF